jgi:hypothetical protein
MIKRRVVLYVLVAMFLCFLSPAVARADSGPIYFSAGVLVPTTSNDIRMTREVLTIDYANQVTPTTDRQSKYVNVHARFWFRNEGKAATQKMGFPLGREQLSGYGYFSPGFTVTVDGVAVAAIAFDEQKPATGSELTYSMWNTFEVPFAAGQTRVVDVTYKILPRGGYFLYVLQTGRLWKGPIGDLTIDVNLGRAAAFPDLLSVQPAGYRLQGNHILWHLTNYEPQQDIEIESMSPAFWKSVQPLKEAAERTGTENDWYRYAMVLLPDSIVGRYPAISESEGEVSTDPLGFVRGLQTSAYVDYVQRTLLTALNHCTHGSANARVLDAVYHVRFSSYRVTADFLNGVEAWNVSPSTRAHDIYENLTTAGTTIENASPEETRLLAWLTVNMAGESMAGGYTLAAIHELELSQPLARETGILDNQSYQNLFRSASAYLSPWSSARLPVGVSSVPRIEIQQQKMDTIVGGPAWRVRIILHQTLPSSDVPFVQTDSNISSQPDWQKMPEIDTVTGQVKDNGGAALGFSDVDPNDYLVILSLPEVRNADEFQTRLTHLEPWFTNLLYNRRPILMASYDNYNYPAGTANKYPLQSASYTWLQAIKPTLQFDMDHGVSVKLDANAPLSNALCDTAETQMNQIIATFDKLSWTKDYQIDETLQHNLQLIQQNRGKNPSVTLVTYAADGTIQRTTGGGRSTWNSSLLTSLLYAAAGLVVGLLLPRRGRKPSTQETA